MYVTFSFDVGLSIVISFVQIFTGWWWWRWD